MRSRALHSKSVYAVRRTIGFDFADADLECIKLSFRQRLGETHRRGDHSKELMRDWSLTSRDGK
jgi:hypothetical protein